MTLKSTAAGKFQLFKEIFEVLFKFRIGLCDQFSEDAELVAKIICCPVGHILSSWNGAVVGPPWRIIDAILTAMERSAALIAESPE